MSASTRVTLAIVIVVASALAGCTSSSSEGSRSALYGSFEELEADSILVVVGTAGDRVDSGVKLDPAQTATALVVDELLSAQGDESVSRGDEIVVWQMGDAATTGTGPLLETGSTYLLFLTLTGLDDRGDFAYFVTGGTAGLWLPSGTSGTYTRSGDEGDQLPRSVTVDEIRDLQK